ncbi:MAG: class I SAM-dependent methyltransferase, partial [Terriglobales bacterium]
PFSRYMELCLYEPGLGFYERSEEIFGKAGDFYTSSDVHALFGRLLARQFEEMWRALGSPARVEIIELGPGRGLFARDVLDWSRKKFPEFFGALHYRLVERSAALRLRLAERLKEALEEGKASIAEDLAPPAAENAILFANEFLDALPVEVVGERGLLHLALRDGALAETFVPVSLQVQEYLDRYSALPEAGERVEAGLAAMAWMERLAKTVARGFLVLVDYGYRREELLAGRHRGTLVVARRHQLSRNPYEVPGEQDITAHVNFTAVAAAGEAVGLQTLGLVTQSQFLMGIGEANQFADAFEECRLPQEQAKVSLQLKHLVTPAGMGENFQVLVMGKGVAAGELSGLKFCR